MQCFLPQPFITMTNPKTTYACDIEGWVEGVPVCKTECTMTQMQVHLRSDHWSDYQALTGIKDTVNMAPPGKSKTLQACTRCGKCYLTKMLMPADKHVRDCARKNGDEPEAKRVRLGPTEAMEEVFEEPVESAKGREKSSGGGKPIVGMGTGAAAPSDTARASTLQQLCFKLSYELASKRIQGVAAGAGAPAPAVITAPTAAATPFDTPIGAAPAVGEAIEGDIKSEVLDLLHGRPSDKWKLASSPDDMLFSATQSLIIASARAAGVSDGGEQIVEFYGLCAAAMSETLDSSHACFHLSSPPIPSFMLQDLSSNAKLRREHPASPLSNVDSLLLHCLKWCSSIRVRHPGDGGGRTALETPAWVTMPCLWCSLTRRAMPPAVVVSRECVPASKAHVLAFVFGEARRAAPTLPSATSASLNERVGNGIVEVKRDFNNTVASASTSPFAHSEYASTTAAALLSVALAPQ